MTASQQAIESAIKELDRLLKTIQRHTATQVKSDDERQLIKAVSLAWFNNHRPLVIETIGEDAVRQIDSAYQDLLAGSGRATTRAKCIGWCKILKRSLTQLQTNQVLRLSAPPSIAAASSTTDNPPSFSLLASESRMQAILENRWQECVRCLGADAPLAATVMMGGILEGLLLAKINSLTDKSSVFKATNAPRDKSGNTLKLNEWGLKNFMDVAHELRWISKTTKDVGDVVRDYRNYIHPQKEHSHGVSITSEDAKVMWEVAKSVIRQILKP